MITLRNKVIGHRVAGVLRCTHATSLTHPIPEPSPRYKLIAEALRECGQDIDDDDFELIDALPSDDHFPTADSVTPVFLS